jgi:hypothetical protein
MGKRRIESVSLLAVTKIITVVNLQITALDLYVLKLILLAVFVLIVKP